MTRSPIQLAIYGAVLLGAVAAVYAITRPAAIAPAPDAAAAQAHDHAAMLAAAAAGGATGRPVVLTDADAQRIGVTYATATLGTFAKEVRTVGEVTYDETRVHSVSTKFDGWVERLLVNATGQLVDAGQEMFTIYSPMLVAAQDELLLARRLEREVTDSAARERASALVAAARRRLEYWDVSPAEIADVERTGVAHRTLTLRAPVGGYVLQKSVLAGQKVMAGDALYRLADLTTVWVEGMVFEQDLSTVAVGQTVHADFQALPGEHLSGRVSFVYPTIDPTTRTARLRVVLPNADRRLKPGMYATLEIAAVPRAGVLTIPRSAVLSTGERSIVFVREAGNRLVPREVVIGEATDQRTEILRGLAAGDVVVSSATFLVDAESNLGTSLGGMGNMPGMDMTTPPRPAPPARKKE